MTDQAAASEGNDAVESPVQPGPPWLRASLPDLADLNFEAPVAESQSADSNELGDLFQAAAGKLDAPDTAATRVFAMLTGVMGMQLRAEQPNDPFGPMFVSPDGRRSAAPGDFRGEPVEMLAQMAERAKHPVVKARLADVCWVLDRKRAQLGTTAIAAYVDIVMQADTGTLKFRFDNELGALKQDARDLLRRALFIGRGRKLDQVAMAPARDLAADLRKRSFEKQLPVPSLWFGHLDLDFEISNPHEVGKGVESLIAALPASTDGHVIVNLWRMASRAYHFAKSEQDKQRTQAEAAEQLVRMAEQQPMALVASSILADAIAELHGVPGKKDRRKELRHRLIDVQADIGDEMKPFSHSTNIEELIKQVQLRMQCPSLRDRFFVFAALSHSPDSAELTDAAEKAIREHPFASLVTTTHHDREGKIIHRSAGAGFGNSENESAIDRQIAQHESIRRNLTAAGIEAARQAIAQEHYLPDDVFGHLLVHSPFVPRDLLMTYSRGFARFFQGDFTSALYILTPLLENSLRHVLKGRGHDVTKFDDANLTQEDRTISSLFDQMRDELDTILGRPLTTDIENVFLKKPGPHLRHALSHGLLHDGSPYGPDALYGCWLIFHTCLLPLFPCWKQVVLPFDDAAEVEAPGAAPV